METKKKKEILKSLIKLGIIADKDVLEYLEKRRDTFNLILRLANSGKKVINMKELKELIKGINLKDNQVIKTLVPKWMEIIHFQGHVEMDFQGMNAMEDVTLFSEWEKIFKKGGFTMDTPDQELDSLNDWIRFYNKNTKTGKQRELIKPENFKVGMFQLKRKEI